MFHYGGSTHALIFRPQVDLEFDLHGQSPGMDSKNIPVRARIATVRSGDPQSDRLAVTAVDRDQCPEHAVGRSGHGVTRLRRHRPAGVSAG
jgi:hypothetical protein